MSLGGRVHTEPAVLPIQALLELPGDISVTGVDVAAHPDVAPLAAGRGELTGLALWLMAEQAKVLETLYSPTAGPPCSCITLPCMQWHTPLWLKRGGSQGS